MLYHNKTMTEDSFHTLCLIEVVLSKGTKSVNESYNKATNSVIAKRTGLHGRAANGIWFERI